MKHSVAFFAARAVGAFLLLSSCATPAAMPDPGPVTVPATPPVTPPATDISYPGQVLDLSKWKLTLPIGAPEKPDEVFQPQLNTFANSSFFRLNATNDAVLFRANADGVTTNGSGYPRSELREMTVPATSNSYKASWSSGSGTHTLLIDQAVTHLPDVKKHIVVGQIHDADDDIIVFRLEDKKLFINLNGKNGPTLTSNYALGTRFTVQFVVANDKTDCYYNGTKVYTYAKSFSGAYFKAGAYVQSSCVDDKKVAGELCSAYGEVAIYNVQVTHQ
ncbi:polysaccharide lyase family 7 protein [Hymenobacter psychrophilus]|uniref:Alginate lyase n=1 Tax=Hymenobacter psychrophilus TaxID=651662 RepID=A0A1H3LAW3_9BACT|nr:polysaccharide lyase family 7 protein [Hymenobacter psychrophilus]SDY61058.1 Alginate lyase [Hymenobacter psychrophilus]